MGMPFNLLAMKKLFFYVLFLSILTTVQSCIYINSEDNIPLRGVTTQTFGLRDFDQLEMDNAFRVTVRAGSGYAVSAKGELNDLDDLNIFVSEGKLVVRYKNSWRKRQAMDIDITMPQLKSIDFSGAVDGDVAGFESNGTIDFELSGASRCSFSGSANTLEFDLDGASQLNLSGESRFLDGELSGASKLEASNWLAEESDLNLSGASTARIWISRLLDVEASGASTVRYKGNPSVKQELSGGSTLRKE